MKKGSGSVVQRNGKYHARWRISGADVYGPARDDWADADFDRVNKKPGSTKAPAGHHPTLQEWAFWCMDHSNEKYGGYGRKISPGTFDTNESIRLNQIEGSTLGRKKLKAIDRFDIIDWAMDLKKLVPYKENGVTKYRLGDEMVSAAWRLRCVAFVSKLFTIAVQRGFINATPCTALELPQPEERINTILSTDELTAAFEIEDRTDEIILFLATTGLRKNELTRIMWSDIKGTNLIVKSAANKGGTQLMPLSDDALAILHRQPKRSVYVFTTASGKPLGSRNLTRDVKKRLAKRGIDPAVRLHDLRGTFTNMLIEVVGADIKTTQTLARHRSSKTTLKHYLRSRPATQRDAVESLVAKLKPQKPEKIGAEDRGRHA